MVFKPLTFNLNQENFSFVAGRENQLEGGGSFGTKIKMKEDKDRSGRTETSNETRTRVKGQIQPAKEKNER